ncbi:pleckstrin homology domain-containing family S member 1 [Elgaria multicarinata webbii]|uniref:pleckstrin homology domain-containing family S member 1 n=1 Tax=Elgaria multicarinata webbii TaxID=159646 RepID=UPI002FCD2F66
MDSPRTISIGNYNYDGVYKDGFFIKSPPLHLFSNQTSWKKRYFILSKSRETGYDLKYLKGQQIKGHIEINENSEIEIGIGDTEKMMVVKKMFKCQPTEVMTIRTENRNFYLIGTDSRAVEEWATFLFATCAEKKKLEPRIRSKSSPASLHEQSAATIIQEDEWPGNEYEELGTSAYKKRPASDPSPPRTSEESPIYEAPRKLLLRLRRLTNAPVEEVSEEASINEEYYASPRSFLSQGEVPNEFDVAGESTSSDDEKLSNNEVYMPMKNLGNGMIPQVAEDDSLKPTPLPRTFKPEKTRKLSFLSVVQLSIVLSEIKNDTQLEELDILLPHDDLTNCLKFTKASGHICVSQWKDPHRLGCIFHQGDSIVAVNDLHIKSMDEISLFISRSTRKKVKLTVRRLPDSDILHAQGCMCS